MGEEKIENIGREKVGEIDYAILISLNYIRDSNIRNVEEEIRELSKLLQIRYIIVERHFYRLVKNESIVSTETGNNKYILTQIGTDAIHEFEAHNEEWMRIDKFIKTSIGNMKQQKIKIYSTADKILTIAVVICIIFILYIVIF